MRVNLGVKLDKVSKSAKSETDICDILCIKDLRADLFEQCLPEIRHIKLVSTHFRNLWYFVEPAEKVA